MHIRDSDYYEELYALAPGLKTSRQIRSLVPHDLHRLRRGALNPFFSKRAITKVEPLIVDRIERLCGRFSSVTETNKVIRLDHAYMTLTMDVVTHCCYGTSFDYLKEEGYRASWKESVIAKMANPKAAALADLQQMVRTKAESDIAVRRLGNKAADTVLQAIIDNTELPPQEEIADRLQDEEQILVAADSEMTAKSLSIITFYLCGDKSTNATVRCWHHIQVLGRVSGSTSGD
ncbi:hypothetical protein H2203_008856 [Taxawa tesnikishii (nom. ined.)]|nr:hypothetical protein H2203_008856 [Dothideales sp. JES 119]